MKKEQLFLPITLFTLNVISAQTGIEVPGPDKYLFDHPFYQSVRNFYVSSAGNDANDGSAPDNAHAWKTIQHADDASRKPGDCIHVASGTYTWNSFFSLTHGGNKASPTGYVTYRCDSLNGCHIVYNGSSGNPVWAFQAPYFIVDGFDVDGGEGSVYGGLANDGFVSIQQQPWWVVGHHIWILNNKVHGCNLGGIGFNGAEYMFSIHNEVYNCAWTSGYEGSGIGYVVVQPLGSSTMGETYNPNPYPVYTPTAQDSSFAPFHNLVLWNNVHDNGETMTLGSNLVLTTTANMHSNTTLDGLGSTTGLATSLLVVGPGIEPMTYIKTISGSTITLSRPATTTANGGSYKFYSITKGHTDGNGIIMDTWDGGVGGNDNTYPYQSLVAYNDAHNNGGRGVHVFATDNVTVANNSVYGNGLDIYDDSYYLADLSQSGGRNNTWINNISQSVITQANPSCGAYCGNRNSPFVAGNGRGVVDSNNTYIHNITYGGYGIQLFDNDINYFSTSTNKVNTNPLYNNPTGSDFTLQNGSPAIGYAQVQSYMPSFIKDDGAYQTSGGIHTGISSSRERGSELVSVYPNPSTDGFTLAFSPSMTIKDALLEIYDICGREVEKISISSYNTTIERSGLQNGIYLYRVFNNNENISTGKLAVGK